MAVTEMRHVTVPERLEMLEHLRELVHAIDARTWHLERSREADLARDAAALRQRALERIAELERVS